MGYKEKMIEEQEEKEAAKDRRLKGYEKKIIKEEGEVSMYCPQCTYALSKSDVEKTNCIHCGFYFSWNDD